jgi:hypothetical protein
MVCVRNVPNTRAGRPVQGLPCARRWVVVTGMAPTGGIFDALAVLVGIAGAAKLLRPAGVTTALDRLHPPGWNVLGRWPVARLVGGAEIIVAVGALSAGGRPWAAVMTAFYLGFTVVAWRLSAGPATDCGCFGAASSPLNRTHVVVDAVFTAAAAVTVAFPPASLSERIGTPGQAVAHALVVALLVTVGFLAFTALPALVDARKAVQAR